MTPAQARVVQAEAAARAARQRLTGSVAAVQGRLRPSVIVREARRELTNARGNAADYTIRRPGPVAIGIGVLAAVVLRKPVWRLLRHRRATATVNES